VWKLLLATTYLHVLMLQNFKLVNKMRSGFNVSLLHLPSWHSHWMLHTSVPWQKHGGEYWKPGKKHQKVPGMVQ
jgi:hypothetical protein